MTAKVEVEIKYRIADSSFVGELLAAKRLGPCEIDKFQTRQHHDTYLDTPDRAFLARGLAFRYRRTATRGIVQLKSLTKGEGIIHRRTELWAVTDRPTEPQTWLPGPAKDLAIEILEDKALQPLFEVRQIRHFAKLRRDGIIMAEMSIDEVVWQTNGRETQGWELEIELSDACGEELICSIDDELTKTGQLIPQQQSKFERGLALLEGYSNVKRKTNGGIATTKKTCKHG